MKRRLGVCFVLILLTACSSVAPAPYMAPIQAYCLALQNHDFDQMRLAMPSAVLNSEGVDAGELDELRTVFVGSSGSDYTITAKERDSYRLSKDRCAALQNFLLEEYGCSLTVDEARVVDVRLQLGETMDGTLDIRAVTYRSGEKWYVDFSASALNTVS